MDSVLLFLAQQSPWLLGAGMLVILIALSCCDDWCTPKRKQPGVEDMPDDVRKEFEEIEKEMADLETELDEMEIEWRRDNPEEAAKVGSARASPCARAFAIGRGTPGCLGVLE